MRRFFCIPQRPFLWKQKCWECCDRPKEQLCVCSLCLANCLQEKHHWGFSRWWISGIEESQAWTGAWQRPRESARLKWLMLAFLCCTPHPHPYPSSLIVGSWVLERAISNALLPLASAAEDPNLAGAKSTWFIAACSLISWESGKIIYYSVSELWFCFLMIAF